MKFVRFTIGNGSPLFGWVLGDHIGVIDGDIFNEYHRLEADLPLEGVRLLAPVIPGKIIGVGRNYFEHAREHGVDVPEIPIIFLKPPSSLIGPGDSIILPPQSQQVEHEAELAVVIGKTARWVDAINATEYILGYTIANDVTARDLQNRDAQWTRGKGFDSFCPLGPWIDTDLDPSDLMIQCRVNNELRQMASTHQMVFTINQIIAFVTSVMTLNPGDVILMGTPAGVGPLTPGDLVEINIENLGILRNPVIDGRNVAGNLVKSDS
jgi:2-keto-4-pentenoate hydratase/2-oxohepta-3-ene-1,7-dioic acid hydratase in catechol pathway